MTVKVLLLTTRLENRLITLLYHRIGHIPCWKCGKVITTGNRRKKMLEETPNLAELLTPATTIDRDARRSFQDNDEGLNATFKADNQRLEKAYLAE